MLVIQRKIGECVYIGDDIIVTVVAISGGKIRLGFESPAGVKVWREEIYKVIKQAEELCTKSKSNGLASESQ